MRRGGARDGAGRPGWRPQAERLFRADIFSFNQHYLLAEPDEGWILLCGHQTPYVFDGRTLRLDVPCAAGQLRQHIEIERTACHFGGTRPWFRCPTCNGRCGVLFLVGQRLRCRACGDIAYRSQSRDVVGASWCQQRKIERRLGEHNERPPRMHWETYQRLLDRIEHYQRWRNDELVAWALKSYPHLRERLGRT